MTICKINSQGTVIEGALSAGVRCLTKTGWLTSPYPSKKHTKYHCMWMKDNAVAACENDHERQLVEAITLSKTGRMTQAEMSLCNNILFQGIDIDNDLS